MSKKQKLFQRLLSGSKNIHFSDFVALVEAFGFVLRRINGSHHIYKHPDVPDLLTLQPTKDGQTKPYQVNQLLDLIEEYNLKLLDNGEKENEK